MMGIHYIIIAIPSIKQTSSCHQFLFCDILFLIIMIGLGIKMTKVDQIFDDLIALIKSLNIEF